MPAPSLFRPDSIPTGLKGYWKLDKGHTPVAQNTAQFDTAQFKFGTSALLNTSGSDRLLIQHSEDWNFRKADFTLEAFVRFNSTSGDQTIIDRNSTSDFTLIKRSSGNLEIQINGSAVVSAAWSPSTGVWYHVAAVRLGQFVSIYVDGTRLGSATANSFDINTTTDLAIGNYSTSTSTPFNGWIDEVRISRIGRYSGASFSAPTSAFTTDADTLLLLHMEGTDAATSPFLDSSGSATNLTWVDSSGIGNHLTDNSTVASVTETRWDFDKGADFESGNSEYLSIADASQTGLDMSASGTDVFTFACFVKFETIGTTQYLMGKGGTGYQILKVSNDALRLYMNGTEITTATGLVVAGRWYHVAFVYDRPNSKGSIYLDGNLVKVDATASIANNASDFQLGADGAAGSPLDGMMKDAAFWTTALTPLQIKSLALGVDLSTKAYRPTQVATAPNAWWKLNELSSGAGAVTRASSSGGTNNLTDGNTVVTGGGYVEGAGALYNHSNTEYLTITDAAQSGLDGGGASAAFSAALWVYKTGGSAGGQGLLSKSGAYGIAINSAGNIEFQLPGGNLNVGALPTNRWVHLAMTYDPVADKLYGYVDGVLRGWQTDTTGAANTANDIFVGSNGSAGGSDYLSGRLADVAIWTTYQLTDSEVASLASAFPIQQAGLRSYVPYSEARSAKTCTAVGNAQVDTAQFKTGAASLLLDGSGDGVDVGIVNDPDFQFGEEDFTIEGYMRLSSFVTDATLFSNFDSPGYIFIIQGGAGTLRLYSDGSTSVVVTSSGISLNTWYHFAVCRRGNKIYFYQDGVLQGTPQTAATRYNGTTTSVAQVGAYNKPNSNVPTGWIDAVRISKGLARYTGTFTPYISLPATDKYTALLMDFEGADASTSFTDLAASGGVLSTIDDLIASSDAGGYNSPIAVVGKGTGNAVRLLSASSQAVTSGDSLYQTTLESKWLSIGGWFMSITASGQQYLMSKGTGSSSLFWNLRFDGSGNIIWELGNGSTFQNPSRASIPVRGTLYHVVGTWDGAKLKLYIDGYTDLSGGTLAGAFPGNTANNLLIGADNGPSNFLNGTADETFYFSRPLLEEEVKSMYIKGLNNLSMLSEPVQAGTQRSMFMMF